MVIRKIWMVCLIVILPLPALAENQAHACPERPEDETEAQALAGDLFAKGEQQYQAGQMDEALQSFLCSLSVIEHENTVFNIAQVARLSSDKAGALASLKRYRSGAVGTSTIEDIDEIIAELEKALQHATTEQIKHAEAHQPGPNLEASQTDDPSDNEMGGKQAIAPSSDTKKSRKNKTKVIGWVLIGTGAAGLVTGSVLQGLAGAKKQNAQEVATYEQFLKEEDKMSAFQKGAYVGFIAGGVLAGTGIVLTLVSNGKEAPAANIALSLVPAPAGLVLEGRF
ncbi:MAG: hypothetical protein QNJ97_08190 [Myxococcota bacterium]|nr:hypothetical protein [Myxococcota bacterium]